MSISDIESKIDALRAKGSDLIHGYNSRIKTISEDKSRSDQWKREQKQEAYSTARAELDALRDQEERTINDAIEHRSRSLTGSHTALSGMDAIARRDAEDRVSGVKSDYQASHLMERALANNDVSLAKALLARSLQFGYTDALNAYAKAFPNTETLLNDIEQLNRRRGLNNDLGRQFFYGAISPAR